MKRVVLFFTIVILLFTVQSFAATFNVSDVSALSSALSTASNNGEDDTINIAAGTYAFSTPLFYNAATGEGNLIVSGDSALTTILDGGESSRLLEFSVSSGQGATITISNLTLQNGSDVTSGAMVVSLVDTNLTLDSCIFQNNHSTTSGPGAAYIYSHENQLSNVSCRVQNSIFINNLSDGSDGSLLVHTAVSHLDLINNTFANNESTGSGHYASGGGLKLYDYSDSGAVSVINNIFWNNEGTYSSGKDLDILAHGGAVYLYNNDFTDCEDFDTHADTWLLIHGQGSYAQAGNITGDPVIVSTSDAHLQSSSPCIDVGLIPAGLDLPVTDFEGDNRILNGSVDIGADEYRSTAVASTASVPTMNEWGMIIFSLLMAGLSFWFIRKRDHNSC